MVDTALGGLVAGDAVVGDAGQAGDSEQDGWYEHEVAEADEADDDAQGVDQPDEEAEVEGVFGVLGGEGVFGAVLVDEPEDEGAKEGQDAC